MPTSIFLVFFRRPVQAGKIAKEICRISYTPRFLAAALAERGYIYFSYIL
jgi:hypothetical protein